MCIHNKSIKYVVRYVLLCRPQFGGNYCVGEARDYETCNTQVIDVVVSQEWGKLLKVG